MGKEIFLWYGRGKVTLSSNFEKSTFSVDQHLRMLETVRLSPEREA